MVKLTVIIDDQKWPHLTMVCQIENLDGTKTGTTDRSQYDTAYSVFENVLHNRLRPMLDQLINRRKPQR